MIELLAPLRAGGLPADQVLDTLESLSGRRLPDDFRTYLRHRLDEKAEPPADRQ